MKNILTIIALLILISCQKEYSLEEAEASKILYPYGPDEDSIQRLDADTVWAVINSSGTGGNDMDFFEFEGPCTGMVTHYNKDQWSCDLLLKTYDEANGTTPVRLSYDHQMTVPESGKGKISVQKADESCPGIVPYKIVRRP